jgi:para-aminobenzoate synthetase / 4-amino-4-deoxychorismate lyase
MVPGLVGFRAPLESSLAPEEAVLWLRDDDRPFALSGDWLGGITVMGSRPVRVADPGVDDPFSLLDAQPDVPPEFDPAEGITVGGGWVGWLGYNLGARIEELPPPPPAPTPQPPFSLAFYDHVILFDGRRWWFEALMNPLREAALRARLAVWAERMRTQPPPLRDVGPTPFTLAANGAAGHVAAVADCRRRIAAGELFQANLCVRLEARFGGELVDLFARALPRAQPRFGALVDGAVSLSPERFLRRSGRRVQSEPIKGTRPRAGDEPERALARGELLASVKDAAEHVMIVDLMRNDIGRVCEYGTIEAQPARVEAHAGVWHLVSTVSGQLRDGVGDADLLRATFPPGSVTGAPKVQAMKVIAALEATRRELYTGAVVIASPVAGLDLSVAIRTFETRAGRIWFGAGGGIVADSDPELELAEALAKAAGPVAAIGGRLAEPAPRRPGPLPIAASALAYGHRPDPAGGVFETLLVEGGAGRDADGHLERLAASVAELYGTRLDPAAPALIAQAAASLRAARSRLRVLADPDGSVTVSTSAAGAPPDSPRALTPFLLPGGLGAHKWRDRELLEALATAVPGTTPLLVDTDGLVLEAAYANLWIVEGDAVITPPADGRILAGITRARLLADDSENTREEPIDLERLARAESIFLTSSIAGRHPARLAGRPPR